MSASYLTKNGRTSKRGAFINGIWHCDCEPRLPAEKFQTKNGGKNHGRWFFTCQKPQPKRCAFFIWSDDAKIREESAVINNSRSEPLPDPEPKTPKKQTKLTQPPTPFSRPRSTTLSPETPKRKLWSPAKLNEKEEDFDWSSSGDEELASVAEAVAKVDEDSPRKAARTSLFSSPGKRGVTNMTAQADVINDWPFSSDAFMTPATSTKSNGLPSPLDSQLKQPFEESPSKISSSLAAEALEILRPITLPTQIEHELVDLLNRHDLRTQGIARGRDITRLAVKAKDKKIAELQAQVTTLEAEKETGRAVIAHLKQDIATSPKKLNRSMFGRRSEV